MKNKNLSIAIFFLIITFYIDTGLCDEGINICCFTLNTNQECSHLKKLADNINKKTNSKINVSEFMPNGFNPEIAFKAMIDNMINKKDSNKNYCEGLIISGHHAGFWDGDKASEKLSLKFLEDLSCDPRYSDWFDNVKALWLQGCRTYRVGQDEKEDYISANIHRLTPERLIDNIEASISEIEQGFSFILDRENPLSLKYLRFFNNATVWGWEESAPGEKSGSWQSILHHIANMIKSRYKTPDITEKLKTNITSNKLTPIQLEACSNILDGLMYGKQEIICPEESTKAWKEHWQGAYGLLPLLLNSQNVHPEAQSLLNAKKNNCTLFRSNNPEELINTVEDILKDSKSLGFGFNSIIEMLSRLENDSENFAPNPHLSIMSKLRNNKNVQDFLWKKLTSKKGFLSKIEYYGIAKKYNLLDFTDAEKLQLNKVEATFKKEALKEIKWRAQDKSVPQRDMRDYKATLLESLSQHGFSDDPVFIDEILEIKDPESYSVLNKIAKYIHTFVSPGFTREKKLETIKKIINHPDKDLHTDKFIIISLVNSITDPSDIPEKQIKQSDVLEILDAIVSNSKITPTIAYYCSLALNTLKDVSQEAKIIHEKIISHEFNINNIEKEMREIYPPEELKTTLEEEKEAIEKAKTMSEAWIKIIDQKK